MKNVLLLNVVFLFFGLGFSSCGGSPMGLLFSVFVGGLIGTVLMDVIAIAAEKLISRVVGGVEGPRLLGVGCLVYSTRVLCIRISLTPVP